MRTAYDATVKPLYIAALVIAFIPLIAGLLTTNYYLGKTQNAVDGRAHALYAAEGAEVIGAEANVTGQREQDAEVAEAEAERRRV